MEVSQANTNPGVSKKQNFFYFSDYHGNVPAYKQLKVASDEFDKNHKDTDNFKLSGGDLTAGANPKKDILVYRLMKLMNIDASAVGNHEWDKDLNFYKEVSDLFKKAPKLLFNNYIANNIKSPNDPEYKEEGLFQSQIINKNGENFGIIGTTTDDFKFNDCKIDDLEQTKKDIGKEVQKLKEKSPGLNKFILLSHLGKNNDYKLAESVSDIDIIIGGHSHDTIDGVKKGENLFMSPNNEPVLVVQAGNEKTFGELTATFDKEGKLDLSEGNAPVNTVKSIYDFKDNKFVTGIENKILGETPKIGVLGKEIHPKNLRTEENPLGDLAADALLKKTNADVVLLNAGSFRSFLNAGEINKRNLEYCMPFSADVYTIKATGKQIADIIKYGVDSTKADHVDPGLYQIAGMRYSVTKDKTVKDLYTVDKNGKKDVEIIDSAGNFVPEKNPGSPREYTIATSEFMIKDLSGKGYLNHTVQENGKTVLDNTKILNKFNKDSEILTEYLQTEFTAKNKPIIATTGLITVEKPANSGFEVLKHRFERILKDYSSDKSDKRITA